MENEEAIAKDCQGGATADNQLQQSEPMVILDAIESLFNFHNSYLFIRVHF